MNHPPRSVYVHIGAPKSGTTFLQNALWSHRGSLADDGVLYPYRRPTEHFEAMLDLREQGWGNISPRRIDGAWQRVARRVQEWDGHAVVLTNELLGRASATQISRLLDSVAPARVEVIYTARDLARQLASSWQEQVKHNLAVTFDDFLAEMVDHSPDTEPPFARHFWPLQDAGHLLARWREVVGHERIHLITVPPRGGARQVLWRRFCATAGLDPDRYGVEFPVGNVGLGAAEAEFFRRVNAGIADMTPRDYAAVVRNGLMRDVADADAERLAVPKQHFDEVRERAADLVRVLREEDYHVVGDLDELVPEPADHSGRGLTSEVGDDRLLALATRTIHLLLKTVVRQRTRIQQLTSAPTTAQGGAVSSWRAAAPRAGLLVRALAAARSRRGGPHSQ